MTFSVAYDDDLARVRASVVDLGVLNSNPYFETAAAPWVAYGGTAARITTMKHSGAAAYRLTPDGVSATARVESEQSGAASNVIVGESCTAVAWLHCTVTRQASININWFTAGGAYLSTASAGGTYNLTANTWLKVSVTGVVPATAARASISINLDGTPPASDLLTIDEAKIFPLPVAAGTYIRIDRSVGGVRWETLRGAEALTPDALNGSVQADDYEFEPGALTTYRARLFSAVDVVVFTHTDTITPDIDGVWLKSVARPYLNRKVIVQDYGDVSRKARAGIFAVAGRTMPVVVSEVTSSRDWQMSLLTRSLDDAHALDLLFASGDIVQVQAPSDCDVPSGYVSVGDSSKSRVSRSLRDDRRLFSVGVTECARPGPDIVGSTATWAALLADFGTWNAVLANFPTWQDVLDYVASPETVVVP